MSDRTRWHVDEPLWRAYESGALGPDLEGSVEAHVMRCERCQQTAASAVPATVLAPVWDAVAREVATPVPSAPLRWLQRTGLRDRDAVLLSASDGLYLPWLVAVAGAVVCAIGAGLMPRFQDAAFLLLAPLVPVLAVVAAYDATDPLRELQAGTPYSRLRLALLRTTAALAVAVPVTMAVGLLVPGLQPLAFAWLVPGLGLTTTALVLLTWLDAWSAGTAVGLGWALVVALLASGDATQVLTGPIAQSAHLAIAAVMGLLLVIRSTSLVTTGGRP
jgi:hypothetical protein